MKFVDTDVTSRSSLSVFIESLGGGYETGTDSFYVGTYAFFENDFFRLVINYIYDLNVLDRLFF